MPEFLTPNMAIIRSPSNWFLVAFALTIAAIVCHLYFKKELNNG